MKNAIALSLLTLVFSCQTFHYKLKDGNIVLKNGRAITSVVIFDNERNAVAKFYPIAGKETTKFSLYTFDPEYFTCVNCSFKFEKEKKYSISLGPEGDVVSVILIYVDSNGNIGRVPK